ncbi:hypothetical protein NEOLEDRAFT_1129217 [Neolentinus lepideus HHB14362 ss-1]|uniref:Uncharacterized protein n=1 Tax=Neolentinus lepideus HHB14362 ss-1 TaxID=1314782 RepID=A0A165UND2_9AGAM|nr:hypothetical protein NEOLEDRAFT_1129217 [Neolentinus lepideus HHB14362 ss-1]
MSRLSTISYVSPRVDQNVADPKAIGLALDTAGVPLVTDEDFGQEKKAKRTSTRRRSGVRGAEKRDTYTSLYGGGDVISPVADRYIPRVPVVDAPAPALARGRERIKAPYPSTSLRASASASSYSSNANPFEDVQNTPVPPLPTAEKSNARRARDTKAITAVLGLTSPPSPEMTIYPDDSLSVVGDLRTHPMPTRKPVPEPSPPLEASASLGNLMLNGFETPLQSQIFEQSKSSSGLIEEPAHFKYQATSSSDKPPRVPSPPPMQSLAQMAMQHASPDEYAGYSCPTYSIYGYYTGEERKSRYGDFRMSTLR